MNFTEASLDQLTVHYTGNKQNGQSLLLSRQSPDLDKGSREKLSAALLPRFQNCHERYSFYHASSLEYNEVYNFVKGLFRGPGGFHAESVRIATHLYEVSLHPKIKPGELYVVAFSNILIDETPVAAIGGKAAEAIGGKAVEATGGKSVETIGGKTVNAIGLFKAETKSLFADIVAGPDDLGLELKEGAELSRIDKGCLILNHEAEQGFELLVFDANGKGEEAQYWKDKFLGVLIRQNEFLQTQGFLTLAKNYVTSHLPGEFEVSKTEQIDLLNRSMDYFKTHDSFNKTEFETEVLHHDDLIHSFRQYDDQYRKINEIGPADEFFISPQAVKKQSRVFKSVIKLDRNFHIYVHGDRELIEKGYDERLQKHFYKIYFDAET